MITAIKIKNFKILEETDWIPIEGNVVFVGPNNSGKTTALQAMSLWNYGIQRWIEKKRNSKAEVRTGAVINKKDLFTIPVTNSKHIWTNFFTHSSERNEAGKISKTRYNNIEITTKGINDNKEWICGFEFRFDSEETIYVKPLHGLTDNLANENVEFLKNINVSFLPPMSGLKLEEEKLLFSTVEYRMGEGRTAEVLGNLCYQVLHPETDLLKNKRDTDKDWDLMKSKLKKLFMIELLEPVIDNKGIIRLKYIDNKNNELDISSSGRGMQQVILLLAYLLIKPNCIMLLDEPDAHLEFLKQEQIYDLLTEIAKSKDSQLLIASHSEVVLRKAIAVNDNVISFYPHGKPHYNKDPKDILKALKTIGIEEFYLAQQFGWVLYLEGGTDLPILKKFAEKLNHPVLQILENCFYKTINTNDPNEARNHFSGLKAAKSNLVGIAIYDHITNPLNTLNSLNETMWNKNEIENYFYNQEVMLAWAKGKVKNDLFGLPEAQQRENAMNKALDDILPGAAKRDENDDYWNERKASSEIEKVLKAFYKYMEYPGNSSKANFIELIDFMPNEKIDPEVIEKLDFIQKNIPK